MKKILSFIIAIVMLLSLGVTAFAADAVEIEANKTKGLAFVIPADVTAVKVVDCNGILTIGDVVVVDGNAFVNITAPIGAVDKLTKLEVKSTDGKTVYDSCYVTVTAPATPVAPTPEAVLDGDATLAVVVDNNATINMNGYNGISAKLYNALKAENFETITFVGNGYTWTLVRGDYTKMNVTAPIYFGVEVTTFLTNDKGERDLAAENAVLKALGNTMADVFYVKVADNVNIGNVASKPALVVEVSDVWTKVNNTMAITALRFDGTKATKVAEGLSIKPVTNKMDLKITSAGLYVFTDDAVNVNTKPTTGTGTQKPNASTGGANSAAAVVAMAVMGAVSLGVKKIVG